LKFYENASSWNRVVPWGWTDGQTHEQANSLYSNYQLDALIIIYS